MTKNVTGQIGQDEKAAFGKAEQEKEEATGTVDIDMVQVEETREEDTVEAEEEGFTLSDDPAVRLEQVAELLRENHEDAPPLEQLKLWKRNHKEIFVLPVADHTYIYRYLKRGEYIKMETTQEIVEMNPLDKEEYVFDLCMLWPVVPALKKATLPAGLISTLSSQIRLNSMFLNPEALAQMTIKL